MASASALDELTVKKMIPTLRVLEGNFYYPCSEILDIISAEYEKSSTLNEENLDRLTMATGMSDMQIKDSYKKLNEKRYGKRTYNTQDLITDSSMEVKQENLDDSSVKRQRIRLKNTHILEAYFQNVSVVVKSEDYPDLIQCVFFCTFGT